MTDRSLDAERPSAAPRPLPRHGRVPWASETRLLVYGSFIVVALLWQIGSTLGVMDPMFFSSPTAVVIAGVREVQTPLFWNDLRTSAFEFLVGYIAAVGSGVVFGFLFGWFRRLGYFAEPWVNALNATPSLALMPLVVLWFGLDSTSKVAIVFITTFVPVVVNTYTAARTLDQRLARVAASFGARRWFLLRTLVFPTIAPFVFAAARIGVGRAVSGVVVGEFYTAQAGLAYRLFQYASLLKTADLLFGALFITAIALGAFKLVEIAERRVLRWRSVTASSRVLQTEDA
jgi:NitT/TauT family transport system permease protein